MKGLESKTFAYPVYCSKDTARVLRSIRKPVNNKIRRVYSHVKAHPIEIDTPFEGTLVHLFILIYWVVTG